MQAIVRLILTRVALMVITLLIVSLILFWAIEWLPGDPATRVLGRAAAKQAQGSKRSEQRIEMLRERMNLDSPPAVRYALWLRGFVRGDWGESLVAERPVTEYVLPRLKNTMILAGMAIALYVPLSLVLGIVTAVFRDRLFAVGLSTVTLVGISVPEFVIGIILMLLFAVWLPLFPPLAFMDQVHSFSDLLHTLALPSLTLTAAMTAYAMRMMQGSLVSVMESEYVRMATLKGLSQRRVIIRHALPNALGPALRVTVLNLAFLIGGSVLVEAVYNYPGIGALLVESIRVLDTPVIEAIAMIMATVYILANLGADLASLLLNPRLRTS